MPYITVEADVSLDDFSDEDIATEFKDRGLTTDDVLFESMDEKQRLEHIYHLMRLKKSKQAYRLMYDYIRDRLGKAV
jgi:hypothetical protein